MRNFMITMFLIAFYSFSVNAQNIVKGIIIDNDSENPLQGVTVSVKEHSVSQVTGSDGVFSLQGLPNGKHMVVVTADGYETQNYPVTLSGKTIDLGSILMYEDISEDQDLSTITITDDELSDDASAADNISGLLQASRDAYLRTAAFDFSGSFIELEV